MPKPDERCLLDDRWLVVGQVVAGFGIRGAVRVRVILEQPEQLLAVPVWHIGAVETERAPVKLLSGRLQGTVLIAQLEGVVTRNQAESLVGQSLWLPRSQLPALTDGDEFYWCDLIGCRVQTETGEEIGAVVSMMATGANDVLVVNDDAGDERLLPLTAEVVRHVDVVERLIKVWLMPGL
ncbi:MAG: 16S rRNA processing protein RimM [Magnetococcales bacterium]|nr:16S rRNA processing protein RimM [Magnetococcales bacterium]